MARDSSQQQRLRTNIYAQGTWEWLGILRWTFGQPFCARSRLVNDDSIKYQTVKCSELRLFANAKPDSEDHAGPIYTFLRTRIVDCNWRKEIWFKSDLNQVSDKLDIAVWLISVKNIHPDKNDVHLELYGLSSSIYFLGRMKF